MKIPKAVNDVVESFLKLPGIGPKTAARLAYYLLVVPQRQIDDFSMGLTNLKKRVRFCSVCKNITENDPCFICSDRGRDRSIILVVEGPLDLITFENMGRYKGMYHVLHGRISPLDNIGPDEIFIDDLMKRIDSDNGILKEIIIATNPTMEGEATAMYLAKRIKGTYDKMKVTRLGMGIPTGADLEYADDMTLSQALDGRRLM